MRLCDSSEPGGRGLGAGSGAAGRESPGDAGGGRERAWKKQKGADRMTQGKGGSAVAPDRKTRDEHGTEGEPSIP